MTQSSPRRLTRSHDRVLGGVAGGLADYLDVDPTIVRVIWVLAVVFGLPLAVLGYFILWLVMPAPDAATGGVPLTRAHEAGSERGSDNGALILGLILILVGALFLLPDRDFLPWFGWRLLHILWPLLLILVGILVLTRSRGRSAG